MAAKKHLHTYERRRRSKTTYRCIDPECTHLAQKWLIEGKKAICRFCGREFILDREALRRKNPRCLSCSDTKQARAVRASSSGNSPSLRAQLGTERPRRGRKKLSPNEKLYRGLLRQFLEMGWSRAAAEEQARRYVEAAERSTSDNAVAAGAEKPVPAPVQVKGDLSLCFAPGVQTSCKHPGETD